MHAGIAPIKNNTEKNNLLGQREDTVKRGIEVDVLCLNAMNGMGAFSGGKPSQFKPSE